MDDSTLNPIEDKFLNTGDLFAMRFSDGLIFLEVTGWQQNRYSPYNNIEEIPADSSSGFQRLEHDGDDILFIEKRKQKVSHVGIGHSPSHVRRYTNFPEGEVRLRSIPNLSTPRSGDDYGYVDGNESPFSNPTEAEELFIPPGVHLDFNFHNADTKPAKPILNIKMREYNIRTLKPSNDSDKNAIKRIVSAGSPIPIAPAGGMDRQVDYDLEDFWGVAPMSFNRARNLGGGR
jgi:hypothetical protein